jgi:hypothetical protein
MTRTRTIAIAALLLPAPAFAQGYDRFHELLNNSAKSPVFWVESFGAGAIDEINQFPGEWEAVGQPFVRRTIGRVGQGFAAAVMEASVAATLDQRVGYEACGCRGVFRRTGHVFWRTFVQRRVDRGFALNVPFLTAKYGSAAVANAWYPRSYRANDVVAQGSFAVATAVSLNLLDEFSPDLLRAVRLR